MSRPATDRLKVNPPIGLRPSLENHRLESLNVDPEYQRSIDNGSSQTLIRRIAVFWDWSLFQPLAVSRRPDGSLFVVDGQHRLTAARMRADITDLPCVVSPYASAADEAASFVAMNAQRRPLGAMDLFKAALAAGDMEAMRVMAVISAAGLSLAPHSNPTAWKPGQISNIAGIRTAFKVQGRDATSAALVALSTAYAGQVLQYAGTIFPGLVRAYAQLLPSRSFDPDLMIDIVGSAPQKQWVDEIFLEKASSSAALNVSGEAVFVRSYTEASEEEAA